jgi:primosomal protein N' (replication factor Y)
VQGVVTDLPLQPEVPETRPVEGLVDADPVLTEAQLKLAKWLERQTLAPLIECLTLMIPPGLSQQADSLYTLLDPEAEAQSHAAKRLLGLLARRGPLRGRQIERALSRMNWRKAADSLLRSGVIQRTSVLDPPRARARHIRTARLAVPPATAKDAVQSLGRPDSQAAQRRRAIVQQLIDEREPLEVTWLYAESHAKSSDLRYLETQGLIALGETEVWRDPLAIMDFVPSDPPQLTPDQDRAWQSIRSAIHDSHSNPPKPILIHGVTGSGKTELYMRAVAETLALDRTCVVLVPEIALTPQTVRRFLSRFPGEIGLTHSKLSSGERYDTWRRARAGLLRVIIGARSALFAPLPRIGLIVLDECHDESYKEQAQAPRYHARETAVAYARLVNAVCLMGSATPDVVTTFRAKRDQLLHLKLPQRILGHRDRLSDQAHRLGVNSRYRQGKGDTQEIDLPPVRVVDMRQELKAGNRSLFSRALQQALQEALQAGQQAILFLNRRGAATYIFCRDCGTPLRCPRCEVSLTYHSAREKLCCHHCGYMRNLPPRCPICGSDQVKHFGAGTQRVETEVLRQFPEARTLRWDWDTTRSKGAHDIILANFASHRADVMIGTQMIAKGLDLPLVTLVGVVSADTGLNLPDFRAAERTFQVLTQVAGRAGRGLLGGRVILQTFQPDHYALRTAASHDYQAFYQQELQHRQSLGYPPFQRLAKLVFRHTSASLAQSEAERLATQLQHRIAKTQAQANLIGPAPCFFRRMRGEYRWQVVLRASDPLLLIPIDLPKGWITDIDPVSLL